MQRTLSILLALLFGLGPLAAALPASEDAHLPACCRRMGAHHCTLAAHGAAHESAQEAASNGRAAASAPDTCPNYPRTAMALIAPMHALVAVAPDPPLRVLKARALSPANVPVHSAPSRTHAGRGPPAPILS